MITTSSNIANINRSNLRFTGYKEAVKEWNDSKSDLQAAMKELGNKEISLVMQGPSFPSEADEDFGIGSPYAKGASRFKDFFNGIIKTTVLGPWGATSRGNGGYSMHSPYLSTLESLNPFFINFKHLTTPEGGSLIKPETFEEIVANKPSSLTKSGKLHVDYTYGENSVNKMISEAFSTYQTKLKSNDPAALEMQEKINSFKQENQGIVLDAVFKTLVKNNDYRDFSCWNEIDKKLPVLLNQNDKRAVQRLEEICKSDKTNVDKYIFTQYLAKAHADNPEFRPYDYVADKQVAIVGADKWKLQDLILQEIDGKKVTLGVPPDMFSTAGRNWGMALLDPAKLFDKDGNITEGGKRVHKLFQNVFHNNRGGVRIDHFIGIIDPFVCLDGSADPKDGAGRLLSSPDNPVLSKYAITGKDESEKLDKYALFLDKIILDAARKEGLSEKDIIPEDIGAVTEPVKAIMDKYNLSSMRVTQFINPTRENHKYRAKNADKNDVITLGTHDNPPLITYYANMDDNNYSSHVDQLAEDLKIADKSKFFAKQGAGKKEAIKAKFAEVFASPAENVHIFFPHLMGIDDYYNKPGDRSVNKWRTRMPNNFEREYFKNMADGKAFNPYDALSKALIAKGHKETDPIVKALRSHESRLMLEIQDMIEKENPNSDYSPLENGISSIEERNTRFPRDKEYRTLLAKAIGEKDASKLSSVIGIQELTEILKKADSSYFVTGGINEDGMPVNPDFRINLHVHTQDSDGQMKIEDLLDQAADYAKKTGRPFLIAVTNHDRLNDAKKAIEIIASNPEKYEQVLFAPGIEFNAKYRSDRIFNKEKGEDYAVQLEEVGYCINPFDKDLNNFLETRREANEQYVNEIIGKYNEWGLGASLEEASNSGKHLKYMGSPGIIDELKSYIQEKASKLGWDWGSPGHDADAGKIFRDYSARYGRNQITPATPSYKEVIDIVEKTGGEVGIAHPARIILKGIDTSGDKAIKTLIDDFVKAGGKFIERNYQYPGLDQNEGMKNWVSRINDYIDFKHPELTKSGGHDNHSKSILKR